MKVIHNTGSVRTLTGAPTVLKQFNNRLKFFIKEIKIKRMLSIRNMMRRRDYFLSFVCFSKFIQ